MTTVARKVGGPLVFTGLLVGSGVALGVGGTVLYSKIHKKKKSTSKTIRYKNETPD